MKVQIITDEQAQKNFNYYMAQLAAIKLYKELKQLSQIVYNLQQHPNGNYLFPVGKSKEFWDAYKERKNVFETAINEAA